jgi:hypothetical protein
MKVGLYLPRISNIADLLNTVENLAIVAAQIE